MIDHYLSRRQFSHPPFRVHTVECDRNYCSRSNLLRRACTKMNSEIINRRAHVTSTYHSLYIQRKINLELHSSKRASKHLGSNAFAEVLDHSAWVILLRESPHRSTRLPRFLLRSIGTCLTFAKVACSPCIWLASFV